MNLYGGLRLVHSYWRWAVLATALWTLWRAHDGVATKRAWSAGDERAVRLFLAALDLQVLLGVVLYFGFSPYWSAVRHAFHAAMKDRGARFFGAEHQTAMLLAFVVAHLGRLRARRAADDGARHRILRTTLLLFFALVAWAIPWPWRSFGRPLFRGSL